MLGSDCSPDEPSWLSAKRTLVILDGAGAIADASRLAPAGGEAMSGRPVASAVMWLLVSTDKRFLGEPVEEDQEATLRIAACVSSACSDSMMLLDVHHCGIWNVAYAFERIFMRRQAVSRLLDRHSTTLQCVLSGALQAALGSLNRHRMCA